jgi:hypothetical protein
MALDMKGQFIHHAPIGWIAIASNPVATNCIMLVLGRYLPIMSTGILRPNNGRSMASARHF